MKRETMNIILINICVRPYLNKAYFPIGIAYVATALERAGYQFDVIDIDRYRYSDDEVASLLGKKQYDVIALGTLVSGYKFAKNIAQIARAVNPEACIVAGNSVASSIAEYLLQNTEVDIAVKGEGELTIVNLLRALESDKPLHTVKGIAFSKDGKFFDTGFEKPLDIDAVGYPNWELFDVNYYIEKSLQDVPEPYPIQLDQIKAFVVNTARGCPFHCTFCYHVFQYTKYRYRSPESILEEIAVLQERYAINYINFFDELTFYSKKHIEHFVDAVLSSGMKFFWNADIRSDLFDYGDMDLLAKVKRSGCQSFGYSLESGNPEILKSMGKKLTVEHFAAQKKALDKAGIKTFTSIVIGYPEETLETLRQTFDVCYDLNIFPSTGYLLPQPGTPMFEIAKSKGYTDDMEAYLMKMGDRQDLRFNLTGMPDDILVGEVKKHLKRISDKLELGLQGDQLVKTFTFLTSKDYQ
jgi:anaerobic magnesium-protoporphyrin IX monomethyl ester cyclase